MADTGWNRTLTKPLRTKNGRTLVTLSDARAYVGELPLAHQVCATWQQAARLMGEAVEGGDIRAATEQLERALFKDGRLDLSREWMRFVKKNP
jgi:hypothetical protein